MSGSTPAECPVCASSAQENPSRGGDYRLFDCPACGSFKLTGSAAATLPGRFASEIDARARLSHFLRKTQVGLLSSAVLEDSFKSWTPPTALEQIDNLVVFLAEHLKPGDPVHVEGKVATAITGALSLQGVTWVGEESQQMGLVRGLIFMLDGGFRNAQLTHKGWEHYRQLRERAIHTRRAFMAMKFGDAVFDEYFKQHWKPAAIAAGFDLRRLDESPEAGLIDNRLRVEIRNSRFLVCDLSHGNQGAYWEAGFAEGLGRPVFYVCSKESFEGGDPARKPHFDTNHQAIIVFDPKDMPKAMRNLTAMIRATLPGEAKMEDQ